MWLIPNSLRVFIDDLYKHLHSCDQYPYTSPFHLTLFSYTYFSLQVHLFVIVGSYSLIIYGDPFLTYLILMFRGSTIPLYPSSMSQCRPFASFLILPHSCNPTIFTSCIKSGLMKWQIRMYGSSQVIPYQVTRWPFMPCFILYCLFV